MNLCLSCFQASQGGPYCSGCGRTFGVKLCPKGHRNAPSSRIFCCTACGSLDMTEPTRYADLSWAAPALAGLVALLLWRWAIAHLSAIGGFAGSTVLAAAALMLDTTPCGVILGTERALAWLLELWLLGWLLALVPGKGSGLGKGLRSLPGTLFKFALSGIRIVLRLAGRSLSRAVWPPKHGADQNSPLPPRGS